MFTKVHRVVALAIFSLIFLAYIYRGQATSVLQYPQTPVAAPQPPSGSLIVSDPNVQPDPVPVDAKDRWNYAELVDALPTPSDKEYAPVPTGYPVLGRRSPYGYVFWATSDEYACSAIVNIQRLITLRTKHAIIVLVTEDVDKEYVKSMEEAGATVHVLSIPDHPNAKGPTEIKVRVENSLMRLLAFRMHQIQDGLRRVLVLDSDVFIYKSLDSLFEMPDVDVAATRDLYAKSKGTMNANFMLVTLSDRTWKLVEEGIKTLKEGQYCNYLINKLFGDLAMILPGQYFTVDKHWQDWTVPAWYHPEADIHSSGMVSSYSDSKMEDLWRVINTNIHHDEARSVPSESGKKSKRQVPPPPRVPPSLPVERQPDSITAEELLADIHGNALEQNAG